MTLLVRSARLSYRGPDRLDVTRKSGTAGLFLAPSWAILTPAIEARKDAADFRGRALSLLEPAGNRAACLAAAERIEAEAWAAYVPAFVAEMGTSFILHRREWDSLLALDSVTICCFCADSTRCHRALLRERVLPTFGAIDGGEVPGRAEEKR